jgi:hypothetical protein
VKPLEYIYKPDGTCADVTVLRGPVWDTLRGGKSPVNCSKDANYWTEV